MPSPVKCWILALVCLCAPALPGGEASPRDSGEDWADTLREPPRDYTLIPFWFWNDALSGEEIVRQIDDFVAHGVHGFVIHPRIGLPEDIGFMSERYLAFVRIAVEHAARRGLIVHLYDEGMYPSGSACGQVVRDDPRLASRCLLARELGEDDGPSLSLDETLVTVETLPDGRRVALVDAPSHGKIRGVHFGQDDGEPGQPPAADLLNPDAVHSFIRHVHEKYREAVGAHFGKTVRAMFTDEPSLLGRRHRRGARPWTTGLEEHLERLLGFDVRPHLPKLFYDLGESTAEFRRDYERAVSRRLEETYYATLSRWCARHGIALTGHPAQPDDIGVLRHFQLPGQDVVWRYLEPGKPSALEGRQSTMGKCSSSAAIHGGRSRNGNEAFGAYGWEFTYSEMRWLTDWLLVRGVDLIWPHAFFYSVRGKRRDERPPDVGPNNSWWPRYREYADYARRGCWLMASGVHRADIAILGRRDRLPFRAAKLLFQSQRDFNYLEARSLLGESRITADEIRIGPMAYRVLILDDGDGLDAATARALEPFAASGRVLLHATAAPGSLRHGRVAGTPAALLEALRELAPPDLVVSPPRPDLRYRHVSHPGREVYFLFNEGESRLEGTLELSARGTRSWRGRLEDGELRPLGDPCAIDLAPHATEIIVIEE